MGGVIIPSVGGIRSISYTSGRDARKPSAGSNLRRSNSTVSLLAIEISPIRPACVLHRVTGGKHAEPLTNRQSRGIRNIPVDRRYANAITKSKGQLGMALRYRQSMEFRNTPYNPVGYRLRQFGRRTGEGGALPSI